jgi:hypothetical protein
MRVGFGILIAVAVIVAMTPIASAQDGWINLFDGETLFGLDSLGDTTWGVEDGVLTSTGGSGGWIATTSQFANFELQAKVRFKGGTTGGLAIRAGFDGHPSENGTAVVNLSQKKGSDDWQEIHVTAKGGDVSATVNGKAVDGITSGRTRGHIGIQHHHREGKVEVAELRLKPLGFTPLFDGKTLDGWNIIENRASKFSVVEGAIDILDGNGQIETVGLYKDFVLQLDIISLGEHLNSGVFFRGPVGVFWKGYESQVRNQWSGDDRTKPVDYGTGGNYGNQNSRKVVSTDGEWFQKTIVVTDNHAAVWIDGYQTSDFTDTRPISRNNDGKNGYVPGPGTIHLQGHDPTTHLRFKNIGLQEYSKP